MRWRDGDDGDDNDDNNDDDDDDADDDDGARLASRELHFFFLIW